MHFCSLTGYRHVSLLGNIYKVIFFLHNAVPENLSLLYKNILSLVIKDYAKGKKILWVVKEDEMQPKSMLIMLHHVLSHLSEKR